MRFFPTVVGSMIVVLTFGHFDEPELFVPYLATPRASGAIALSRMASSVACLWYPWPHWVPFTPVLPGYLHQDQIPVLALFVATLVGCASFALLERSSFAGRRMIAALMSGVAWAVAERNCTQRHPRNRSSGLFCGNIDGSIEQVVEAGEVACTQGCTHVRGPMGANTWGPYRAVIESDGRPLFWGEPTFAPR